MKILFTSGGTKVNVDAVRSITNMSRGTFGSAICKELLLRNHEVDFVMAEGSRTPFEFKSHFIPKPIMSMSDNFELSRLHSEWLSFIHKYCDRYHEYTYKTFEDYSNIVLGRLGSEQKYDMVILAAAVSDYDVDNYVDGKIRSSESLKIHLVPYPKIITEVKKIQPETFLVGFKLMVNSMDSELISEAQKSIEKNGCDIVVANDLLDIRSNNHKLTIVSKYLTMLLTKDACEKVGTSLSQELVNYIICKYISEKSL